MSEVEDLAIGRNARTFVVSATAAGLTAFYVGFLSCEDFALAANSCLTTAARDVVANDDFSDSR